MKELEITEEVEMDANILVVGDTFVQVRFLNGAELNVERNDFDDKDCQIGKLVRMRGIAHFESHGNWELEEPDDREIDVEMNEDGEPLNVICSATAYWNEKTKWSLTRFRIFEVYALDEDDD